MIMCRAKCGHRHGPWGFAAEPRPQRYEAAFRDNEINKRVLPSITQEDLKEIGVGPVGHRRILLEAIAALRSDTGSKPASADSDHA